MLSDLASWGLAERDEVHLLLPSGAQRRKLKGARYTVVGQPLPSNSLARTLGRVYVICPELLYVTLAARLSFVELLELGHELCGTYRRPSSPEEETAYGVRPLTTVAKLRSYARRAEGLKGRKAALRSLSWVADNSRSPAETALSIIFRLPYRHGGYGLGAPLLNHTLPLNEAATRAMGRDTMSPDLFWTDARYPCEYDGTLYHSSRDQADYDERRRNAYAALGMGVTIIRTRHMRRLDLLDVMAGIVRRNTGIRKNRLPADYELRHRALYDEAFAYWTSWTPPALSAGQSSQEGIPL